MNKASLSSLKRKEAMMEKTPTKSGKEVYMEKKISKMSGKKFIGKR